MLDASFNASKWQNESFTQNLELCELNTQACEGNTKDFAWATFAAAVKCSSDPDKVQFNLKISSEHRAVLMALAAVQVQNSVMLEVLQLSPHLQDFVYASDYFNMEKLLVEGLTICISCGLEDFAIALASKVTAEISLFLIFRAGEQKMLRLLKCLHDFKVKVAIAPINAAVRKFNAIIARKPTRVEVRFPGSRSELTSRDVLTWACLTTDERGIEEVLRWGMDYDSGEISLVLLNEGLHSLFARLIVKKQIKVTAKDVLCMLNCGHIDLVISVMQVISTQEVVSVIVKLTPPPLQSYEVVEALIAQLANTTLILPSLYLLSLVQKSDWDLMELESIYSQISTLASIAHIEQNPLANNCNPLLCCVALSETCERLSTFRLSFKDKFLRLADGFRQLASHIQDQYIEFRKLKILYMEKTFGGKSLFDLISANTERYRALLNSEVVVAIVQDLWTGGDQVGLNFQALAPFTAYYADLTDSVFSVHKTFRAKGGCMFQLHYWKRNGSLRFFVEALGPIGVFVTSAYAISRYIYVAQLTIGPDGLEAFLAEVVKDINEVKSLTSAYLVLSSTLLIFTFQKFVYKCILRETFRWSSREVLEVALFICVCIVEFLNTSEYGQTLSMNEITDIEEPAYATIALLCGFRMIYILTQIRAFGPMLNMIFVIMRYIAEFLTIYVLILLVCSVSFPCLFWKSTDYFGSIPLTFRTLFQWSMGGMDASVFQERVVLGSLMSICWVFLSSVILLNLLIALLSSRYDELAPQYTADYVSIIYKSYSQTRYEAPFGSLVIVPAPFNMLTSPLILIYWFFPKLAPIIDPIFVVFSYQLLFGFGLLGFIAYLLVYAMLTYGYVMWKLGIRSKQCAVWICFGPFYLCYLIKVGIWSYCKVMYQKVEEEQVIDDEAAKSIGLLVRLICEHRKDPCVLPVQDIIPLITRISKTHKVMLRDTSLSKASARVFTQKPRWNVAKKANILAFIEQFKSYHPEHEEQGQGYVNVTRVWRYVQVFAQQPQKLAAINTFMTQKAMVLQYSKKYIQTK